MNEKDILLKDCLERLHAALRAERVQLAKEEEARAWADECQSKLLYEAQNHLVAKTAAEVAETKLAEALSAKEKHDILLRDAHTMLQSAQASAAEERENGVELAQKLACVEEEKIGLAEQVKQLSKQVADLSQQLDEERETRKSEKITLEDLKAAAEEDAKRATKELENTRICLNQSTR